MLNYFFLLRVLQHIFYEAGGKHPFSSNKVSLVRSNHCKALYIKTQAYSIYNKIGISVGFRFCLSSKYKPAQCQKVDNISWNWSSSPARVLCSRSKNKIHFLLNSHNSLINKMTSSERQQISTGGWTMIKNTWSRTARNGGENLSQ